MAVKIPNDIIISDVSITQNIPVYKTTSMSESVRVRDRGIHYLTGSLTFTSVNPRSIEAFLMSVKNSVSAFDIELSGKRFTSQTITSGTPINSDPIAVGAQTIPVDAFTGTISAGDVFNFLNYDKLYYVVKGGGSGSSISVYPPVKQAILANTQMRFTNAYITARLEDSSQTVSYDEAGEIGTITVNWREVV